MNKTTEKIICPKCGSSEKIIPIIYRCKPGITRSTAMRRSGANA